MTTSVTHTQPAESVHPVHGDTFGTGLFTIRLAAIMLLLAGWGWNNGQFVQPLNTSWGPMADALHLIPIVVVLPLGLRIATSALAGGRARGAEIGVSVIAVLTIVLSIVMIVLGATNPDPNSVGVHTAEDWLPVIVMNAGTLLWLGSFVFGRRAAR